MSHQSENILTIFSSEPISFILWVKLLNFFDDHNDQLDLEDVKLIVDKCEECRLYLNEITRSGKIEQEDTFPNVYVYLEELIEKEKKHNTEVTNKSSVRTTLIACHQ